MAKIHDSLRKLYQDGAFVTVKVDAIEAGLSATVGLSCLSVNLQPCGTIGYNWIQLDTIGTIILRINLETS